MKQLGAIVIFTIVPLLSVTQKISNVYFEPEWNQVNISYDIIAVQSSTFTIELFVSYDNGNSWKGPLKEVSGDVGDMITDGRKPAATDSASKS